jgi:hypothetical protein
MNIKDRAMAKVFNVTFYNTSIISWWSVLLVEETRLLEKTTDLQQVTDTLYYHIMLYRVHLASAGFKLNVSGDMH